MVHAPDDLFSGSREAPLPAIAHER